LSALPSVEEIAELAKLATTEEQDELARLLELHVSLESPLSLALRVTGGTQPFAHTALIDRYLTALVDHALYHRSSRAATLNPALPHGIDVPAVFVRDPVADDGSGWFEHPETKEQPIYNLALSCPPQHGKSFMVSHHLLAWYLLKYPTRQAAVVSYEETFATTWAYKVRQLIEAHPEYGVYLDPSTRAKGEWILKDHGGGLMAAGVGGPLTGRSIHLLVIDDPIKNAEQALSDTHVKGTQDWWTTTAKTRNQSPRQWPGKPAEAGVRVAMMTRWSKADLIGYTQRTEGDEWFLLNLPALSEGTDPDRLPAGHDPDPLGRPEGQALAPMLHSKQVLERLRDAGDPDDPGSGGEFWFAAMYQGYPTVEGQGLFSEPYFYFKRASNKFNFADGYVCYYEDMRHFASVDLAISTKTRADWTVFMELGQCPDGRLAIVDVYRFRLEAPDHEPKLRDWLAQRGKMMFVAIEDKTFGSALIQQINRTGGFIPRPMKADVDKITRAIPAGQAIRNERVWWPTPAQADWVRIMEAEMSAFPTGGVHDDTVDALAYAVQAWLTLGQRGKAPADLDQSMQAKVKRDLNRRLRAKKGRPRHPILGRL
jgi:predicted phage terminase large subunit-like protein